MCVQTCCNSQQVDIKSTSIRGFVFVCVWPFALTPQGLIVQATPAMGFTPTPTRSSRIQVSGKILCLLRGLSIKINMCGSAFKIFTFRRDMFRECLLCGHWTLHDTAWGLKIMLLLKAGVLAGSAVCIFELDQVDINSKNQTKCSHVWINQLICDSHRIYLAVVSMIKLKPSDPWVMDLLHTTDLPT